MTSIASLGEPRRNHFRKIFSILLQVIELITPPISDYQSQDQSDRSRQHQIWHATDVKGNAKDNNARRRRLFPAGISRFYCRESQQTTRA